MNYASDWPRAQPHSARRTARAQSTSSLRGHKSVPPVPATRSSRRRRPGSANGSGRQPPGAAWRQAYLEQRTLLPPIQARVIWGAMRTSDATGPISNLWSEAASVEITRLCNPSLGCTGRERSGLCKKQSSTHIYTWILACIHIYVITETGSARYYRCGRSRCRSIVLHVFVVYLSVS